MTSKEQLLESAPAEAKRSLAADLGLLALTLLIGPPGGFIFSLALVCRARFS